MASSILSVSFAHQQSHKASHFHDCHQIIFITLGSASIQAGAVTHTASAGNLVIFSRFEQHAVTSRSQVYERYVLHIHPQPDFSGEGQRLFSILSNRPEGFSNVLPFGDAAPEVRRILAQMHRESEDPGQLSDYLLDLWMQELLILICRRFPAPFAVLSEERVDVVYRIQRQFESDCRPPVTLQELSEEYGLSISYLSHLFKKVTGHSVMGYLLSCRIAQAKKYLAETPMGIGQIVESCGFSDSSNFSRTFKQLTGCSPSQFRKKYQPD